MMDMVNGWEWLILMGGLVACFGAAIVVTLIQYFRDK